MRPAGHVANVGVHGKPVELELQNLWISNITMTMVAQKKIPAAEFINHRFALGDILEAYDVFGRAAETKALKVILTA